MRRLLAVACTCLLAFAATAADARVVVSGKRCPPRDTGAGWPAEMAALRARPNAEVSEDARTLAIALPAQSEAWYYTKAGHPAHPAKAHKIISVIENRAVKVHVEGTFNGSKSAFYTWLKGLSQDDELGVAPRP
jgi:hypothetical protein